MTLEEYLYEKRLSLRAFADIAGISYTTVFRVVRGFEPVLSTAFKIQAASSGAVTLESMVRKVERRRKIKK